MFIDVKLDGTGDQLHDLSSKMLAAGRQGLIKTNWGPGLSITRWFLPRLLLSVAKKKNSASLKKTKEKAI